MHRGLGDLIQKSDIVHGNGMWEYTNWHTARETHRWNKPYVVSFHGSIMHTSNNWGLRHQLVWSLLDGRYVRRAQCLHACTTAELSCIREAGLKNPVAVVPNGIELWPTVPADEIAVVLPEFTGMKTVLFLSRIHPSKGVFELVRAWSAIGEPITDWQLVIAGPGFTEHIAQLKSSIKGSARPASIRYIGPLYGKRRIAAFQACNLFVCPSKTENFGVVVGEALASGKPVIATRQVPWPELVSHKCGWLIPDSVDGIAKSLVETMQLSDEERIDMGERGRHLIMAKYTWPKVADMMHGTYEWILGGGFAPVWVHTV